MKILAIGCTPNLYYYTSRGLKIEIDYKTTTQIFPFFLTRPKNISLGTPDMYTPNVSQYVSQFTGYDFIVVGYDMKDYPAEFLGTGGYTHSVPVNNAIWCTVRKDININSYITHEIMHSLVYYLNVILGLNKSNATMIRDCMDSDMQNRPYYLNYDPENPDSNYSQTWNQIRLHLDKLNNIKHNTMPTYKYFKASEIVGLKPELVQLLDKAREIAGVPFKITSGYRDKDHNSEIGGVQGSSHTLGLAVDLAIKDSSSAGRILLALVQVGFKRFGFYKDNHIHVDLDNSKLSPCYWVE